MKRLADCVSSRVSIVHPTRQFPPLNYLRGYPPELLAQVGRLITEGRLGETLRRRYPEAHDVRTDHALYSGAEVSSFYDSMIAKVIAHGATRDEACQRLANVLDQTIALGLPTNKAFLATVLRDEEFGARGATTDFLSRRFVSVEPAQPDHTTVAIAATLLAENSGYGEWNS